MKGRNRRGVGKRLVERAHDAIDHLVDGRLHDLYVVVRVELRSRERGRLQLVVRGLVEPDGGGGDAGAERVRHVGDDQSRVDAAGEERPERHFAFEPFADGRPDRRINLLLEHFTAGRVIVEPFDVPVPAHFES